VALHLANPIPIPLFPLLERHGDDRATSHRPSARTLVIYALGFDVATNERSEDAFPLLPNDSLTRLLYPPTLSLAPGNLARDFYILAYAFPDIAVYELRRPSQ
jgi:hypothetical protein